MARRQQPPPYDIVHRTEREVREDELRRRRRRYLALWVPCMLLVLFGFLVPAPVPWRIAALAVAAPMLPLAAFLGTGRG